MPPVKSMTNTQPAIEAPVLISTEAYLSEDYARAERDALWRKVWQLACRVEEIPNIGDYVTYDILDDSIIIVRTAADTICAYHNGCQHRGRRLTEGCGHAKGFGSPGRRSIRRIWWLRAMIGISSPTP